MVDKDKFRKKIIEVSSQIFSQYGFRKTTMEEIANALRKGKSSIYYYYKSKEEIFEAVIDNEAQMLKNELTTAIRSTDDPQEKLRIYVKVKLDAFEKLSNYYNAIFNSELDHFEFIEKQREKYDLNELAFFRYILWLGVKKGDFKLKNTSLTAMAVQTALKGLERPLFWGSRNKSSEHRIDATIDILFYGISAKERKQI